jgi:hypothetical protein
MIVAFRPAPPDSLTDENLRAKVEMAVRMGVSRVDFYHYGLVRLDALDRIHQALAAANDRGGRSNDQPGHDGGAR